MLRIVRILVSLIHHTILTFGNFFQLFYTCNRAFGFHLQVLFDDVRILLVPKGTFNTLVASYHQRVHTCSHAKLFLSYICTTILQVYALYQASLFFTSIGGAYSLDSSSMTTSMYDSLSKSSCRDVSPSGSAVCLALAKSIVARADVPTSPLSKRLYLTTTYHTLHPLLYRTLHAQHRGRGAQRGRLLPPRRGAPAAATGQRPHGPELRLLPRTRRPQPK